MIAIPTKRYERPGLTYLNLDEIKALLAAPDRSTWLGRRDHAMLLLAVLTGVRVTELVTLTIADVTLGAGAHIKAHAKAANDGPRPSHPRPSRSCANGSKNLRDSSSFGGESRGPDGWSLM